MNAVAISPSRPFRAATVADDNQLVFYHGPPFRFNSASRSHSKFVYDVAFSPDGKSLVSVGADAKAYLYDGKTGESKGALNADGGHKGSIFAVGWEKSSARVVTASADQTIKLWDVESNKVVQYLPLLSLGHLTDFRRTWLFGSGSSVPHQQVGTVFTTSSAAPIVSLSLSGILNYLDPSSAKPIRSVAGHQKPVISLCATESKSVLTGSYDGRVCAWDIASGDAEIISEDGGGVVRFASSESHVWSISQDDILKEIDIQKLSLR